MYSLASGADNHPNMPRANKPVVVSRYHLEQSVVDYANTFFDFIPFDDCRASEWRTIADAVMVRGETITSKDVQELGPKLRFVGKHGVGTNAIAVKELAAKGIKTMNAPGVNVGHYTSINSSTRREPWQNLP